jgi:hypothetical protein
MASKKTVQKGTKVNTRTTTPVVMHMASGDQSCDGTHEVTTLCGERFTPDPTATPDTCHNYIVCALCEAAYALRDIQLPRLEQGELW